MDQSSRRKLTIIGVIATILVLGLIVFAVIFNLTHAKKNQFGEYIAIQNYDQVVKNLSKDMKDSIQTSLYNTVKLNGVSEDTMKNIKDAVIRDSSDSQNYDQPTNTYTGAFIIDIASIKQSYQLQYSYSETNTDAQSGSPVILTCLDPSQLKYGTFNCKDLPSEQSNSDPIMQYLPFQNLSFKVSPDLTSGSLILIVDLDISQSDLGGDQADRADTVALYKNEVTKWITSKGLDPTKYTYKYNYSDAGDFLGNNLDN